MKCIGKKILSLLIIVSLTVPFAGCSAKEASYDDIVYEYENEKYNSNIEQSEFTLTNGLCVTNADVNEVEFSLSEDVKGAALFDLSNEKVLFGHHLFDRIYPASITKIMTALLLIENSNLDDTVTVPAEATDFPSYASLCGLQTGDTIKLKDLLYGLLLPSGNDAAAAIAIHVGGSINGFADMMNQRAVELMATGTHFVNPHGLDDDNHYTTPYDLYLIFNEVIKHDDFLQVIMSKSHECEVVQADGTTRTMTFDNTNQYISGAQNAPDSIIIDGGKTGTTGYAGNCLIILSHNAANNHKYISMILGASSKPVIYSNLNGLFEQIASE
ncbi:MAG: D-alanyl-D-alanine carboxypeptidase family protein [Suipraeoptans sp.]